jgi:hypothetical protein
MAICKVMQGVFRLCHFAAGSALILDRIGFSTRFKIAFGVLVEILSALSRKWIPFLPNNY